MSDLKVIEAMYPLPKLPASWDERLRYHGNENGNIWAYAVSTRERWATPAFTPFAVVGQFDYPDGGIGLVCRVMDLNGEPREVRIPREKLTRPTWVLSRLFDVGLKASRSGEKWVMEILRHARPGVVR